MLSADFAGVRAKLYRAQPSAQARATARGHDPKRKAREQDPTRKAREQYPKRKAREHDPQRKARQHDPKRKAREHDPNRKANEGMAWAADLTKNRRRPAGIGKGTPNREWESESVPRATTIVTANRFGASERYFASRPRSRSLQQRCACA